MYFINKPKKEYQIKRIYIHEQNAKIRCKKKLYMPLFVYCRESLNFTTFFVQKNTSESDEEKNINNFITNNDCITNLIETILLQK